MFPTHQLQDPNVLYDGNGNDAYAYYTQRESFNSNDSIDRESLSELMYPYCGYESFSAGGFSVNIGELTSSFQGFTIDVAGIERELSEVKKRDTDLIRQDFIRNGIDSSISEKGILTARPSTINSSWPKNQLPSMNNQSFQACWTPERTEEQLAVFDGTHKLSTKRQRMQKENDYCVFCYNNREEEETYLGHTCRDADGHVVCPRLMKYVCPYCSATGVFAHTKKYCPRKPIITPADLENMVLDKGPQPKLRNGCGKGNGTRDKKFLRF
ncbi:uncharacterized protein LOC131438124 [Malaya genurostris]|uniref:uncharacterized protein LOC131438124 n=1 Tax=Malaya genurostris TaxID=325434 RepID=UPI0026F3B00F|nr:uncharacterized protein LOC131438124 [Malaya genurostris]